MNAPLLRTHETELPVETFLLEAGDMPPAEVEKSSADTRAWRVTSGGRPFFAKWVDTARYEARLAKDAALCSADLHPAIVRLLRTVRTGDGVLLVFEWAAGENLGDAESRDRFFALPPREKMAALCAIFGALAAIADAGWVLVDFYHGNVLYDFATGAVKVFDFELFERGDGFTLRMDRNYGSSRLMAPEEFVRGAWIDQATNVFTLGRFALCSLSTRTDEAWRGGFQAGEAVAEVVARATRPDRSQRFPTVRAFADAFTAAAAPPRPTG